MPINNGGGGGGGGGGGPSTVIVDTTTGRTLTPADAGKWIRFTNAAGVDLGIQLDASGAWPANAEVIMEQAGLGQLVLSNDGLTINSPDTLKSAGQSAVIALKRVDADTWTLTGRTAAS